MTNNNMPVRLMAISLAIAIFAGCVTAQGAGSKTGTGPQWYLELGKSYPDRDYIAVIGTGDSRRMAEQNARGELSKRFKVSITVDTKGEERYREIIKNSTAYSEHERDLYSSVESSSDATLADIRFSDPYTDSRGQVSIVAYLVKSEATTLYRSMISRDQEVVKGLTERSADAGSKLRSLALIDTAVQVSTHSDGLIEQLDIINPPVAKIFAGESRTQGLLKQRDEIAKGISVAVAISGDRDGKVTGIVTTILEDLKFTTSPKAKMKMNGSLLLDPNAGRTKDRKGVRWTLNISLTDETGETLATVFKEQLEEGISDREVQAFAMMAIEKLIKKDLARKINSYMTGVAFGK